MPNTTFTPVPSQGNSRKINVSRGGRPFGQLWTWVDTPDEQHPWHAKVATTGKHECFWPRGGAKIQAAARAKEWITQQ